ncbi:unnamed protein product [Brachionus calyciflorus]|uniref:Anion exchange protein n=1 Tax=Brachionus calyciflorus TaxID=104777 RepID=A0A813MGA9_9BILA|nr:unnamed protein product [Brachionus calyciflorus]
MQNLHAVEKDFNLDPFIDNLMSQNVDEQEEYELIDKDKKQSSESSIAIIRHESDYDIKDLNNNNFSSSNSHIPVKETTKTNGLISDNNEKSQMLPVKKLNTESNNTKPSLPIYEPNQNKLNKKTKIQRKIRNFATRASKFEPQTSNLTHEIYVELEELKSVDKNSIDDQLYEWREVSRWIKYEQTLDSETNIWNRPFVGALVYQSLLYLKTGLQYGTVLLKCDQESLIDIVEEMVQNFIDSGHMNKENRDLVKRVLLSNHRHNSVYNTNSITGGLTRKKSTISEFLQYPLSSRRQSTFTADNINNFNSENTSVNNSRKNSSIQYSDLYINKHRNSTTTTSSPGNKKLSISEYNLENECKTTSGLYQKNISNRENSVKFFTPSNPSSTTGVGSNGAINSMENNLNNMSSNYSNKNRRRSTIALLKSTLTQSKLNKSEQSIRGIAVDAEACKVLVGCVDFLDRPVMGFIRLVKSQVLEDFVESSSVKVRFIFVLLGPRNENIDYIEIGRCIGTLMTNKEFHTCVYQANDRRELIEGISYFTNKSLCLVLPLGDFDHDLMNPIVEWVRAKMKKKLEKFLSETEKHHDHDKTHTSPLQNKYKKSISISKDSKTKSNNNNENEHLNAISKLQQHHVTSDHEQDDKSSHEEFDPFRRTGRPFGSLILEIKYRYSKYLSDFKDALNLHCLIAFIFIFTVCIASALSFGGILADKTNKWFGVNEMLIATSMNGIISGLFSGQPLMILGPTGPFLVFEEMLYQFCSKICLDFLAVRCWVAAWVLIYSLVMLALEGVWIIRYVTRFTEEIFAFLIATVFLTDAFKKIVKIFETDPLHNTEYYCSLNETFQEDLISTMNSSYLIKSRCDLYEQNVSNKLGSHMASPNIALLSLILLIGTCCMALSLKKLRRSIFLGARVRRTLCDVGMLISIILMVIVDSFITSQTGLETQKLDIPNSTFSPTEYRKSWIVSPLGENVPAWVPFAATVPALLIFIVLFFEVELTGMILYAKHRKLKKGTGFNLDLLIMAFLMNVNSLFGLPWMCAAPVRTLAHWASLTVYSKAYIPGEKPKLIDVKEQRLTNICVHLAIGVCLLAKTALKMIPVSVLFGIFLYFGIVSLSGTQLYERIKLIFIPSKYCPNVIYARGVRPSKRNIYTFIQIFFIIILLSIKSFSKISYAFPIVLVIMVPIRLYILPKLFTPKELEQLDNHSELTGDLESSLDFYELTHLPI